MHSVADNLTFWGILTLIGLIIFSIIPINVYSKSKYDYKPFTIGNYAIIAIPSWISIILVWYLKHGPGKYVNYKYLYYIVILLIVLVSCIVVGKSILKQTRNMIIALYSPGVLLLLSMVVAFIFILVLVVVLIGPAFQQFG
jgi:hypothetical protein